MAMIGISLVRANAYAAASILVSGIVATAGWAKLPPAMSDETQSRSENAGSKSASLGGSNLFSVRTTTTEKMKAMSNVSFLTEQISHLQERSVTPAMLSAQNIPDGKKELVVKAFAASQARQLASLLNQRGTCLALIGEHEKAMSDLDEALVSDKQYAPAFNNRAWMRAHAGELDSALSDVDKAIELDPSMAEAYDTRGTIRLALKQYEPAMKDFNSSISHRDSYAEAYYHRGMLHKLLGHSKEHADDEKKAIDLGYPVP
jgi:tetratricopeptide (TPR) repeat protein